jgi:serine protease AprX
MCASICAGTKKEGGAFDGVAPDATVLSCKTHFYDSELAAIYDVLTDLARSGEHTVIATNSFGTQSGDPPLAPPDSEFIDALDEAIEAGVKVFFSAGNYHHLANGDPDADHPNTIWLHKSRADLMTVGACKPDGKMWFYSSRGPGQHFGLDGMNEKPDVVAPTPPDGCVVYGSEVRSLKDGWGTSGCCPQVAGLAALLLSARPALSREQLFDAIRDSARPLGNGRRAEGHGVIDCHGALQKL